MNRKVALKFVRPEFESINIFAQACTLLRENTNRYTFTFVVPKNLTALCSEEIQNYGFTSIEDIKKNKLIFDDTVECTAVLSPVESSKRLNFAARHIAKHCQIITDDKQINPPQRGLVLEGVCDPCDGYGSSTETILHALDTVAFPCSFIPTRSANMHMLDKTVNKAFSTHRYVTNTKTTIFVGGATFLSANYLQTNKRKYFLGVFIHHFARDATIFLSIYGYCY